MTLLLVACEEDPGRWLCVAGPGDAPASPTQIDEVLGSDNQIDYHRRMAALFGERYEAFLGDPKAMFLGQQTAEQRMVEPHGGFEPFIERLFDTDIEELVDFAETGQRIAEQLMSASAHPTPATLN